ncbi:hypothetical protein CGCTS75_v003478 [Colletotrichum tropicale]|nr:hypothetical protein CGCTS75_v003478 [Colletotrichum tropicale]
MEPSVEGAIEALRRVDSERGAFYSNGHLRPFWTIWNIFTKEEIKWDPIINLLRRPWFQRTWVFQEAVLARHGQVICGAQSIPWTVFERSVLFMAVYKSTVKNIPAYESMDSIVSGVSLVASVRLTRDTEWKAILPLLGVIAGTQPRIRTSLQLLDLILESRSLSCTNPEDRIFGMLGVTSQDIGSEYLAKDSSLSAMDFFRNFVLWDVFHNDSLRALGISSNKTCSQYSSPSWVPDFERLDPQRTLTGTKIRHKFNASARLPKQVWASDEETVLHIKGRIVDTLHTVGKGAATAPDTFTEESLSLSHLVINKHMIEEAKDIWLAATKRLAQCRDPVIMVGVKKGYLATPQANGKISWTPFLRTLMCDRTEEGRKPTKDFILEDSASFVHQTLQVDVIPEHLLHLKGDRPKAIAVLRAFLALTESRRFAATDIGLTGYVPMRAKKGDLVCILFGSEVPFVVRREAGGKYSLVGECYIHGIMYGQALTMAVIKDEDEVFSLI